jgi:hypothetical protein
MYKNAKSCVRDGFNCSDFFPSNIGVRQGENRSSLLFSVFLNDLTPCLLLENITTLVLAVFTFNFQVSQYKYIALRADCNSAAVSANITVSSVYVNCNTKYV